MSVLYDKLTTYVSKILGDPGPPAPPHATALFLNDKISI